MITVSAFDRNSALQWLGKSKRSRSRSPKRVTAGKHEVSKEAGAISVFWSFVAFVTDTDSELRYRKY